MSLVEEALVGLFRARSMTALSTLMIAISIYIVGVFFLVAENLRGVVDTVRDETAITVFLRPEVTDPQRAEIEKVATDSGLVARVRRVTAEEARARFALSWKSLAAAASSLPKNPFPESFELDLLPDAVASQAISGLIRNLSAQTGCEEVQFDVEWIRRLRGIVALARTGGILVGSLLVLGAAFTIANVVRLTILLHRDEIEILRLVGAPEVLIRGPFLLGGMAQGLFGGILAVGLLFLSFRGLVRYVTVTENALLGVFVVRFIPTETCAALTVGGLLAGLLGGAVAVRKRNL